MTIEGKKFGLSDAEETYGNLTLGRFLRSWRLCEELNQKEFAKKLGISSANLCDIEKGRKGVSIYKAAEIGQILGYPPTVLVQLALQELVNTLGLNCAVELKNRA